MHQTTVRFGPDLWEALEVECGRLGVSAAQYLREAAVARLSYTAGRLGEEEFERALVRAGAAPALMPAVAEHVPEAVAQVATAPLLVAAARTQASEQTEAARAVAAQSELVRRRSERIRADSLELRRLRRRT